jgi:hypothetical protein
MGCLNRGTEQIKTNNPTVIPSALGSQPVFYHPKDHTLNSSSELPKITYL